MPIFVLNSANRRVAIPAGALSVSITGAVSQAALELGAAPGQPVMQTTPHLAVLPQLAGPVTVTVRPIGAPGFAPGTVVHLVVAHDSPDEIDPYQVLLDPVDISGEAAVTFAELHPNGRQVEVRATAVADTPLSPLATAARTSARRLVGRGGVPASDELTVAVNASASMRPWFANGSAAAATDFVVGVADALGMTKVGVVLVGAAITPVDPGDQTAAGSPPAGGLADALRRMQPRWSVGARWSRLRPDVRTVVCSDYPGVRQPFPAISFSDDPRVPGPRLPSPRPGQDAATELLANPQLIDLLAGELVAALSVRAST